MSLPLITLTSQLAREPLPVTGAQQVAFLLVEARASEALAAAPRRPLNLALVLDRSGSMRGPRLQHMKAALKRLIGYLTPDDVLAIVTYDDTVSLITPARPADDPEGLLADVELIEHGGGTAMALGLSLGLAELRKYAGPDRLSRLIVLSDGATADPDQCLALAEEAGAAGISIMPIGYGAEWDDALLERIGVLSGGAPPEYVRVPADIDASFIRQLSAARAVVAPGLTLDIRFVTGVTPRRVTRVAPFLRPADAGIQERAVTVRLGDLAHDAPQALLIELLIAPRRGGTFRIAQIETSSAGDDALLQRADVVVTFSASASRRPQMRPVVVHYVERANAARIVLRALEDDGGEAVTIAPAVAQLFDADGRAQIEVLRAGRPLSPEGRKVLLAKVRDLTGIHRKGEDKR
jgi:Ca-activated chloride channel family protein